MTGAPEVLDSLRFEILGPVRAFRGERQLDLGPAKQRAVLAVLLVNLNRAPLFDTTRERVVESRATALESWAEAELRRGNCAQLVLRLVELVAEFPFREELRYLLILALYQSGRQAEALTAYRDARQLLSEEFGVEPGERLRELHRRILRGDPTLAPVPAGKPPAEPAEPAGKPPAEPAGSGAPPVVAPVVIGPALFGDFDGRSVLVTPPARSGREVAVRWLGRFVAVVVPIVTFGFATWTVTAYYAFRRRSRRLALTALGFLGLPVLFVVAFHGEVTTPAEDVLAGFGILGLMGAIVGGAIQGLLLNPATVALSPDAPELAALVRRVRRDQARQLVNHHPVIARELRIGRPDLPRAYDDGGLIDINSAPFARGPDRPAADRGTVSVAP